MGSVVYPGVSVLACQSGVWSDSGPRFTTTIGVGLSGGSPNTVNIGYKIFCALTGVSNPNGGVNVISGPNSTGRYYWQAAVNAGYGVVMCID